MENEKRIIWPNLVKNMLEVALYEGVGGAAAGTMAVVVLREALNLMSGKDMSLPLFVAGGVIGLFYGLAFYADTGTWRPVINEVAIIS